jgi:hypothetical protein
MSLRHIGVEIETSKIDCNGEIKDTIRFLKGAIVSDGSISGVEVVSPPASGDKFLEVINKICSSLANDNAEINTDCGLHCHIEAKDLTWYDIRKVIKVYAKIENELYSLIAKSRRNNQYCHQCGEDYLQDLNNSCKPKDNKKTLMKNIWDETSTKNFKERKYGPNNARYHGLNLQSWLFRGTIEFRMHQGTINASKIINWGLLLASIIDFAANHTEKEIDNDFSFLSLRLIVGSEVKNRETASQVKEWIKERKEKFM